MIHLKKHTGGDHEYIRALDIMDTFHGDECDPKIQKHLQFLFLCEEYVNYFNDHTSTAFGNTDLAAINGKIQGYCLAKNWSWDECGEQIRVRSKGGRTLYLIDKVPLSEMEKLNRKELAELMDKL